MIPRRWLLWAGTAAAIAVGPPASAQDASFFGCDRIVFFGPCERPTAQRRPNADAPAFPPAARGPERVEKESLWAEPVRRPDGALEVYVPPKPVREFLEDPTPERAQAYLDWNRRRLEAFDQAAAVLREATRRPESAIPTIREFEKPAGAETVGRPPETAGETRDRMERAGRGARVSLVFAFAAWCPYSQRQLPLVNQIASRLPVTGVVFDSSDADIEVVRRQASFEVVVGSPTLRDRLGVRSYPTILVYDGSRVIGALRGFHPLEEIEAAVSGGLVSPGGLADRERAPAQTCRTGA